MILGALLALVAAGNALALDGLVKRDLDAFRAFAAVRVESLDAAIARKDRDEARNLAGRLHEEECRFLERVVRYLREDKNPAVASELEGYLADFKHLSLKDSVRMRRASGPGRLPIFELANAALTGTKVPMAGYALPAGAPAEAPAPAGAPARDPFPGASFGIGTQVPSRSGSQTTALLTAPKAGTRAINILKSDLADEPYLASNRHSRPANLDSIRSHSTGSGAAVASPATPAADLLPADGDTVLASQIRKPTQATGPGSGPGAQSAKASQIRVPLAPSSTPAATGIRLRRGN